MWIEKKVANECHRAVACYLSSEEEAVSKSLHCEAIKFAAISKIRDLQVQCDDVLRSADAPMSGSVVSILSIIKDALDFCVEGSSTVSAAHSRWMETRSSFQKSCPDVSIF